MEKTKTEQIKLYIVVALIIAAATVAYFRFFHSKKPRQAGSVPVTQVAAFNIPQVKAPTPPEKPVLAVSTRQNDADIRDLFVPLAKPIIVKKKVVKPKKRPKLVRPKPKPKPKPQPKPLPTLRLSGTLTAGKNPIAIIDDQFLRIGDTIFDFRVVEISQNQVKLVSADRQMILKVNENTQ